jgi:aspartate/methionine/tyrosine aminotransferase
MVRIADRIKHLGTETAFAVSAEAAAFGAKGNKIYPFHLGDLNFPTPSSVVEGSMNAIRDGKTGYCPTAGIPKLREVIAADINAARGTNYTMDNVAIQPGGKPVITKFFLALMNPGDEVLYPNPGYPIYESQIEFNGGVAVPYSYLEGKENFLLDLDAIQKKITPKTKFFVLNNLHNPTGAECSSDEHEAIARFAIKNDLIVLSDEAYFDMRYEGTSRSIASLPGMQERTVILYTFSKKFAMTGWRLGAAIGPKAIIDVIAKLNVNNESCSNHFIQYGAIEGMNSIKKEEKEILGIMKKRRDIAVDILNSIPGVRCYRPHATFYLYPNVTEAMKLNGYDNYETFRKDVLHNTGVSFCTRQHFGKILPGEKNFYVRFAYSGIDENEIREGLEKFKKFMMRNSAGMQDLKKKSAVAL